MKTSIIKLVLSIILLAFASSLISCRERMYKPERDSQPKVEKRIKIIEENGMYELISVDGVEYIGRANGGMCKHEK